MTGKTKTKKRKFECSAAEGGFYPRQGIAGFFTPYQGDPPDTHLSEPFVDDTLREINNEIAEMNVNDGT